MRHLCALFGTFIFMIAACGGSPGSAGDAGTDGTDSDGGGDGGQAAGFVFPEAFLNQQVNWYVCDLIVGSGDGGAQCAEVTVPLDWAHQGPVDQTIDIHIKRLLSQTARPGKQMWLLHGGPGGAGSSGLAAYLPFVQQAVPEMDMYVLDHRGVGLSARMGCPVQEDPDSEGGPVITMAELEACASYIVNDWLGVEHFTTTAATIDLAGLIELNRRPGQDVFVLGISYGAYWGHRYAQMFPSQSSGIILDSIAPPGIPFEMYDIYANHVVRDYLGMCSGDPFCHSKLGEQAWDRARQIRADFEQGHCSELTQLYGISPAVLDNTLFTVGRYWEYRLLIPALLHRLERCQPRDVRSIMYAYSALVGNRAGDPRSSPTLGFTIMHSEMVPDSLPTQEQMQAWLDELLFEYGVSMGILRRDGLWPEYQPDSWVGRWAGPDAPVLMLNGTLDLQTPMVVASPIREHLTGPQQYFVEVPNANHGVVSSSPVQSAGSFPCGLQILASYVDDPLQHPDTSCLDDLRPISFEGSPEMARNLMLTSDLWEDVSFDLACELPQDYLEPLADDRAQIKFRGTLTDLANAGLPGMGELEVSLDGQTLDLDSYSSVAFLHDLGEQPLILVQSTGSIQPVAGAVRYKLAQLVFSQDSFRELKAQDEHQADLQDANVLLQVEDRNLADGFYRKVCPIAAIGPSGCGSSVYLCHEQNQAFEPGEPLSLALNLALTNAPDALGPCKCTRNQQAMDCTEYDSRASARRGGEGYNPFILPKPQPGLPLLWSPGERL